MLNELKPIFEQIDASLFTEDTLAKISTLIEEKVKERSDAQIELAVEAAISSFDEDVTKKTQHLIETFKANIDQDHTAKIKFVVEKLNADHMEKLLNLNSTLGQPRVGLRLRLCRRHHFRSVLPRRLALRRRAKVGDMPGWRCCQSND